MGIEKRMMRMSETKKPLLQLRNINKSFGETAVIKDISISINEGELVSFYWSKRLW